MRNGGLEGLGFSLSNSWSIQRRILLYFSIQTEKLTKTKIQVYGNEHLPTAIFKAQMCSASNAGHFCKFQD